MNPETIARPKFSYQTYTMINNVLTQITPRVLNYTLKDDGTFDMTLVALTPDNQVLNLDISTTKFYKSIECYENNQEVETIVDSATTVLHDIFNGHKVDASPNYWIWENDKPVKHTFDFSKFSYNYRGGRYSSTLIPEDPIYARKDVCLSFNEYKVKEDGKDEYMKIGINKLIMLEEDQRFLMGELRDILSRIKEAGILLTTDSDDKFRAYNVRNVKDYYLDTSDSEDDYEETYNSDRQFQFDFGVPYYGDDYVLYVEPEK